MENPMMHPHNGTLRNPSWKAVEMSQTALPWSAFILTEHGKTHHGGLSRFAGISTIWGVSKLETLPNPNRSLAGMYRWCQHLTAKFNSFVVFRGVATQSHAFVLWFWWIIYFWIIFQVRVCEVGMMMRPGLFFERWGITWSICVYFDFGCWNFVGVGFWIFEWTHRTRKEKQKTESYNAFLFHILPLPRMHHNWTPMGLRQLAIFVHNCHISWELRQKTQRCYDNSGGMWLQEYHQKKEIYRLKCVWEGVGTRKEPINFYHIKFSFILFLSIFSILFHILRSKKDTWWYMLEISILISWILFWTWTWWNMMQHICLRIGGLISIWFSSKVCRWFTQF